MPLNPASYKGFCILSKYEMSNHGPEGNRLSIPSILISLLEICFVSAAPDFIRQPGAGRICLLFGTLVSFESQRPCLREPILGVVLPLSGNALQQSWVGGYVGHMQS